MPKRIRLKNLYANINGEKVPVPALKGKDAEITKPSIEAALGYIPADEEATAKKEDLSAYTKTVKVAGTALVKDADGAVDVPIMTKTVAGVAKFDANYGISLNASGTLFTSSATEAEITAMQSMYKPVTALRMPFATKNSLTNPNAPAWTAEEQDAACLRMGAVREKPWVLKGVLTRDHASVDVDMTGCTEVYISGAVTATSTSVHIFCKIDGADYNWVNSISTNGARYVVFLHNDSPDGIMYISGKTGPNIGQLSSNVSTGYSRINGQHVSDITGFSLTTIKHVTDAELKIYAR